MRSTEPNSIAGHLTAAKLFGYQPEKQLPEAKASVLQNDTVVKAVYPAIKDKSFAMTMDNYRKFVSEYNIKVKDANTLIDKHNAAVQIYKKDKQLADYEKDILVNFLLRNAHLNAWEYNEEIDQAGEIFGRFLEKRRIQTIKPFAEQVFQNMLHLYNKQLMKRNEHYMRFAIRDERPIQYMEINAYQVTTIKRPENDVISLPICNKTVRNHRARLQEAGIIIDYTFCGTKRGIKCHINPEILVILDMHTKEITSTENQLLNLSKGKELPNSKETTRTFLEEYKKSESATPDFGYKELPKATTSFVHQNIFYPNTGMQVEKSKLGGRVENVKVSNTLSDNLRELIMHPQDLAEKLAAGHFNNYIPIDKRLLFKEAYSGTLTRLEFRELVIQDFFKSAAKLYRYSTAFAGSWKNAINSYMNYKFLTYNGVEFNKSVVFEDITQLRWRLEDARKWFAKPNVKVSVLYPSSYFDFTRNTKKEVGFEYTAKRWDRHVKELEKLPAKKRRTEKNAEKRKEQINHTKKYEDAVRLFLKGKKDFHWLTDYIENNLPISFYRSLRYTLESLQTTINA
ncbi:hypothetical protein AMR72_16430 [Flavobacterium psychrophilum]|nr:hypothetical protein AMR72_16430 [Flavobacterium psychrophilum]AOE53951.1 hypothetical protein ALW18_16420 [Flavobacterium psychrophilum]